MTLRSFKIMFLMMKKKKNQSLLRLMEEGRLLHDSLRKRRDYVLKVVDKRVVLQLLLLRVPGHPRRLLRQNRRQRKWIC
jgi:hypothetical protein